MNDRLELIAASKERVREKEISALAAWLSKNEPVKLPGVGEPRAPVIPTTPKLTPKRESSGGRIFTPGKSPRPSGGKWKANGSIGLTLRGATKERTRDILLAAISQFPEEPQNDDRVKCFIQIFEKIPE